MASIATTVDGQLAAGVDALFSSARQGLHDFIEYRLAATLEGPMHPKPY